MSYLAGDGGGGSTISVGSGGTAAVPRGYSQANVDENLDELIRRFETNTFSASENPLYIPEVDTVAYQAYLDNLKYIRDHPPMTRKEKEARALGIDDILDAIFYASAIASVIPFPAFQIGGQLGMVSANTARAMQYGNTYQRTRAITNLSRTVNRTYRLYTAHRR